jgi:hypothetical protein
MVDADSRKSLARLGPKRREKIHTVTSMIPSPFGKRPCYPCSAINQDIWDDVLRGLSRLTIIAEGPPPNPCKKREMN